MATAIDLFDDTHWLLEQWARWAKTAGHIGYPSVTPYLPERAGGIREPQIGDDVGLFVNAALAALRARDEDVWAAVQAYYLNNCNMRHVAREMDCHRRTASERVDRGVYWIDAYLGVEPVEATECGG